MDDTAVPVADGADRGDDRLRAADGRVPGRRGRATRRRLLDETLAALEEVPYRDLKVVDISRRAGTSPATFYQYFPDVKTAVLALTEAMVEAEGQRLRALVTEPDWEGADAARGLAEGFMAFFRDNEALLRVVDLATGEGDERFRELRIRLLNGVFLALRSLVDDNRAAGRVPADTDPGAVAGVLTTMLAHVSAHRPGFASWGVGAGELTETMATMVDWSIRGHFE